MVTFRFLGINPEGSLQALINGECDVLDQSTMLDSQLSAILELKSAGKLNAVIGMSQFTELLAINIKPSAYDDGYNVAKGDRPDIFGNPAIRKAMMQCINRDALNNELLGGLSKISGSYLPVGDPLIDPNLQAIGYDSAAGAGLLEQAGWRDHDNDPSGRHLGANPLDRLGLECADGGEVHGKSTPKAHGGGAPVLDLAFVVEERVRAGGEDLVPRARTAPWSPRNGRQPHRSRCRRGACERRRRRGPHATCRRASDAPARDRGSRPGRPGSPHMRLLAGTPRPSGRQPPCAGSAAGCETTAEPQDHE